MTRSIVSPPPPSMSSSDGDVSERKFLVQQAQAQIDEEIIARYLPVCALRTKRNALSPVSRLPDELLATVFTLYVRQYHISEWAKVKTFSSAPARVPPWLRVSYVCRHWRMVALNCPTLWTYIFFVSRTWVTVLLQRSQIAPLRVRIDLTYSYRRSLPMLEMLLEHLPRMEEFHVRGLPPDGAPNIISKLLVPAPLLQSLQLTASSSRQPLPPLDASTPTHPVLFDRTTPKLRFLDLTKLDIAWNALTLSGITSLRLFSMPRAQSMQQLSSILSQIPRLRDLELDDVLPWSSSSPQDPPMEEIALPRLSRLCISATIPDAVHFLSHIRIPPDTETRLKCVFGGHASLQQLLSYVQGRLRPNEEGEESTPRQPIRSLSVEGAPPRSCFVTCSTLESGYKHRPLSPRDDFPYSIRSSRLNYDWSRDIPLKMDIKDQFSTALTQSVMIDVFRHLALAHLQSLSVCFNEAADLQGNFWKDLFDLAPILRFIKIRQSPLHSFITTLAPDHHGWRGQNQTLAARALEGIELEQVSFATTCTASEGGIPVSACDASLRCLCDALARRRHAGFPLKKITILNGWNVGTAAQVDELREVVCTVNWDGVSNEYIDAESP